MQLYVNEFQEVVNDVICDSIEILYDGIHSKSRVACSTLYGEDIVDVLY